MASIFVEMAENKISKSKLRASSVGISGEDEIIISIEANPENFCKMYCKLIVNPRFGFVTKVNIKCDHYANLDQLDLISKWQQDPMEFCEYFDVPISFSDCILNYNLVASWCNNWFIDNVNSKLMFDMDLKHPIESVHEAYYVLCMCKKTNCKITLTENNYAYSKVDITINWHNIKVKDSFEYKCEAFNLSYLLSELYNKVKDLDLDEINDDLDLVKFIHIYETYLKS